MLVGPASPPVDNRFAGVVEFISYLGAAVDLHVRLSPKERVIVQVPNRPDHPLPAVGTHVAVGWSRDTGRVFAA